MYSVMKVRFQSGRNRSEFFCFPGNRSKVHTPLEKMHTPRSFVKRYLEENTSRLWDDHFSILPEPAIVQWYSQSPQNGALCKKKLHTVSIRCGIKIDVQFWVYVTKKISSHLERKNIFSGHATPFFKYST